MAESSPGNRLQPSQQAEIKVATLSDVDTQKTITTFRLLLENGYGPRGQLALLHNNSGGHVSMTSSSGRLLPLLSITNPVIRLIYTTLISHVNAYKNFGLFSGVFALDLVLESYKVDIHRRLIIDILGFILQESVQFLNSESCRYKLAYKSLNIDTMLKVVKSCIAPKSGCGLTGSELDYISNTLVQIFLKSISRNEPQAHYSCEIAFLSIEGKPTMESHTIEGIMFQAPQYPTYLTSELKVKSTSSGDIRVALVNISMSGDSDLYTDVTFEISDENVSITGAMVEIISDFARRLLEDGVGVLLSQKVVHPKVKGILGEGGVLVVDRLGKVVAGQVEKLTGSIPIKAFSTAGIGGCYGHLQSVIHKVYNRKSYLHLQGVDSAGMCTPVCTLVLCNRSEESLSELKYNCESALHNLKLVAHTPSVLVGAGCWQTGLVHHLRNMMTEREIELSAKHHCTKYQIQQVSLLVQKAMYKTLKSLWRDCDLYTDTGERHLWPIPCNTDIETANPPSCACGAVKFGANTSLVDLNENGNDVSHNLSSAVLQNVNKINPKDVNVLDVSVTALNALRVAMGTASMVIGINNCISDRN